MVALLGVLACAGPLQPRARPGESDYRTNEGLLHLIA